MHVNYAEKLIGKFSRSGLWWRSNSPHPLNLIWSHKQTFLFLFQGLNFLQLNSKMVSQDSTTKFVTF